MDVSKLDVIILNDKPFYFRDGTSDSIILASNVLCDPHEREYNFPSLPKAKTILDIGANIGAISVLMANLYPDAIIHSFEPVGENFDILLRNIELYPNIKAHNIGLGSETKDLPIFKSNDSLNFGGSSLYNLQENQELLETVKIININEVLDFSKIDLIKIDCEGAEFDILTSLDKRILTKTTAIVGELHGYKDFQLLEYLSQYFHLSFEKDLYDKTYQFRALLKG